MSRRTHKPDASQPPAPSQPDRRPWFYAAGALGLAASSASAWVHYRILQDPTYASFCDVNTTLNCTQAYSSQYGAIAGVPVAIIGVVFFAFVLVLTALCSRSAAARQSLPGYLFGLSTAGLAGVLYFAYASFFILKAVCVLCVASYAAIILLFLVSGSAARFPMTELPGRASRDVNRLLRTPAALVTALAFVAAAAAAIVLFPEQRASAAAAADAGPATAGEQGAVPAATATQVQQLEQFLEQQPRVPVPAPADGAAVVIVKFNDYQCPPCRQTYLDYKPVLAKYEKSHPGKVKMITRDYPLEAECNQLAGGGTHLAACEAAAAVRLAREKGKATQMEEWLFANQPTVTPQTVKDAARMIAGVTDFDERYAATLELVRADVAQGGQLQVQGTPTFFMNGIRLPGLRAEFFDAAIAWELRKTGAQ